jgi:hypothetical protein
MVYGRELGWFVREEGLLSRDDFRYLIVTYPVAAVAPSLTVEVYPVLSGICLCILILSARCLGVLFY